MRQPQNLKISFLVSVEKMNRNLFNSLQACRPSFSKENVKSVLS